MLTASKHQEVKQHVCPTCRIDVNVKNQYDNGNNRLTKKVPDLFRAFPVKVGTGFTVRKRDKTKT